MGIFGRSRHEDDKDSGSQADSKQKDLQQQDKQQDKQRAEAPHPDDPRKPDSPADLEKPSWKFALKRSFSEFLDDPKASVMTGSGIFGPGIPKTSDQAWRIHRPPELRLPVRPRDPHRDHHWPGRERLQ